MADSNMGGARSGGQGKWREGGTKTKANYYGPVAVCFSSEVQWRGEAHTEYELINVFTSVQWEVLDYLSPLSEAEKEPQELKYWIYSTG